MTILYCEGEENIPASYKYEAPFNDTFDIKEAKPGMLFKVKTAAESCTYHLEEDSEAAIKVILETSIKLYQNNKIKIIEKAEDCTDEQVETDVAPSIVIYFVQKNDTLWEICKKFNVSIPELIKVNNLISEESLQPGQQVLIPKKQIKKTYKKIC